MYLLAKLCFLIFTLNTNSIKIIQSKFNYNLTMNLPSFRVCGSYCGPGWCNDKWISESNCDESVHPEYNIFTGYSCADLCCQKHDSCCGNPKLEQKNCNSEIINCLSQCNPLSLTCTLDGIPIPAAEIEFGMNIINKWCCGTPCK